MLVKNYDKDRIPNVDVVKYNAKLNILLMSLSDIDDNQLSSDYVKFLYASGYDCNKLGSLVLEAIYSLTSLYNDIERIKKEK